MIIKSSCLLCVSLFLMSAALRGSEVQQSNGEQNEEEKRCFISGAAEARGAEVNVDFIHKQKAQSSCGYLMYSQLAETRGLSP